MHVGSKVAAHHVLTVPAHQEAVIKLRLYESKQTPKEAFGATFSKVFAARKKEHDDYYGAIFPKTLTNDETLVCIQSFAGLFWSKQFYYYVVEDWLEGDPGRNS